MSLFGKKVNVSSVLSAIPIVDIILLIFSLCMLMKLSSRFLG